jgi:iron complex transport system substrate-binding protein
MFCAQALLATGCNQRREASSAGPARIVSLAPAITETLFEIGAGDSVIAVSDYCDSPAAARTRQRVGTSITPNYEAIARLSPTLVLGESNVSARVRELEALARTRLLPWLTLPEITSSIRELGQLTGRTQPAEALAKRLSARLSVPEPQNGPRVLLVLGNESYEASEIWFIRKNSLHGAALAAAGARNAVAETVSGPPRLSTERLLQLDPDAIVILTRPKSTAAASKRVASGFERLTTLRAVREGHLAVLETELAFSNGPRIVFLVDAIRKELEALGVVK